VLASRKAYSGFTLAELLIALAILGTVAAFTIPKTLIAQQNSQYNAKSKEVASMVAAAYSTYKTSNTVSASTRFGDLTNYLNYVSLDTSSTIDDKQTLGSLSCNVSAPGGCLVLHNGGVVRFTNDTLAGTNSTNAIEFYFDPNGTYSNTTNGPDKSIQLFIYYGGRVTSRGNIDANTVSAGVTYTSANNTFDPPWFSW
jgi:prepilin-type N-terminal cleavage/methylation domain-containing protein